MPLEGLYLDIKSLLLASVQVNTDLQNLTAKLSCPQGCKHVAALLLNGIVPPRFLVAKLLTEDRVALCIGNSSAPVPVQSPGNA